MSNSREILTFQFGHYANHVGSHWWNFQENSFDYITCSDQQQDHGLSEIDHNIFYREGINQNKVTTYTPRLLLVDLNGAFKNLSATGELYSQLSVSNSQQLVENTVFDQENLQQLQEDLNLPASQKIEVISQETGYKKHEFQEDLQKPDADKILSMKDYNLVDTVESWPDYLYARFHPRTVNVIRQYHHNPFRQSFGTFQCGVNLWQTEKFQDDFAERIRQYMEECDLLQGFQLLCDGYDGFAGLSVQCLEYLNDEYHKSSLVWPVFSPRNLLFEQSDDSMSDSIRVVNMSFAYANLSKQASLFVPLSTRQKIWRQLGAAREISNQVCYREDNLYHTSAILATFLDTSSLDYRLKNTTDSLFSGRSLAHFCNDLSKYGRTMAAASIALPFPMSSDEDLIDCLDKLVQLPLTQLTPNCPSPNNYVIQNLSVRGIGKDRLKRPRSTASQKQMQMAAYRCDSISEMLQMYMQCVMNQNCLLNVTAVQKPQTTQLPFPTEIFSSKDQKFSMDSNGFLIATTNQNQKQCKYKIKSLPCLTSTQSYEDIGESLASLYCEAKRVKLSKFPRFRDTGLEDDEFKENLEELLVFSENYNNKYNY